MEAVGTLRENVNGYGVMCSRDMPSLSMSSRLRLLGVGSTVSVIVVVVVIVVDRLIDLVIDD